MLRAIIVTLVLGVTAAHAGLNCRGVFDYDTGKAHFRCRFQGERIRRVRAVCRDGQAGCDADGACDGSCRFALCADGECTHTIGVDVPLRNGGRTKRKTVFRTADARVVLTCLPRRGQCPVSGATSTTVPVPETTTTTTLPSRPCTATLTGAVEASLPCTATLERSALGLRILRLEFEGSGVSGAAGALLIRNATGAHQLGRDMIVMVVGIRQPPLGNFQGVHEDAQHHALVQLDSIDSTGVHGSVDAMLPASLTATSVGLHAEF
jgi:hypothetical protein